MRQPEVGPKHLPVTSDGDNSVVAALARTLLYVISVHTK